MRRIQEFQVTTPDPVAPKSIRSTVGKAPLVSVTGACPDTDVAKSFDAYANAILEFVFGPKDTLWVSVAIVLPLVTTNGFQTVFPAPVTNWNLLLLVPSETDSALPSTDEFVLENASR